MNTKKEYKTPRNEFHAYLQRVNKASIHKDKKKETSKKACRDNINSIW